MDEIVSTRPSLTPNLSPNNNISSYQISSRGYEDPSIFLEQEFRSAFGGGFDVGNINTVAGNQSIARYNQNYQSSRDSGIYGIDGVADTIGKLEGINYQQENTQKQTRLMNNDYGYSSQRMKPDYEFLYNNGVYNEISQNNRNNNQGRSNLQQKNNAATPSYSPRGFDSSDEIYQDIYENLDDGYDLKEVKNRLYKEI